MTGEPKGGIRRLGPGDQAAFADLMTVFGEAFEDRETYTGARPGPAYVERLLGSGHVAVLVAEAGGRVVGGLLAYELMKPERERSEFYVYDLAVDAAHRRQGLATALIESLRGIARGRGAHVIFVQADHGDDPAIALYTGLGRREDVLHFDIDP